MVPKNIRFFIEGAVDTKINFRIEKLGYLYHFNKVKNLHQTRIFLSF